MTIEDQAPDSLRPDSGYGPELKRTLGPFQVFAISFAFNSVAVGVFGTYDDARSTFRRTSRTSSSMLRNSL